jgi:hypothetical protein
MILLLGTRAQAQSVLWEKTFGTETAVHEVQPTADGGYITIGSSGYYPVVRIHIMKTDASGNKQWEKLYGGTDASGGDNAYGYTIQQNTDGSYLLGGQRNNRMILMKLSSGGDSVWSKNYGGTGHGSIVSLLRTSDGFVAGGSLVAQGNTSGNIYYFKTDASGNVQWEKTLGGGGVNAIRQTSDGGYIIAGMIDAQGSGDPYLLKTNSSGDKAWDRTYPGIHSTNDRDEATGVQQTSDGYIVTGTRAVTGSSFDTDLFLLKTDASGSRTWEKAFGGSGYDGGNSVRQASDGGFVVAGWEGPTTSYTTIKVYLLKTDASGSRQWDFEPRDGYAHSLLLLADGNVVIAGATGTQGYLAKISTPAPAPPRYFVIVDAKNNPIAGQEFTLYHATMKPGNDREITRQTTDPQGRITIDPSWYNDGDSVRIARVVYTAPTKKPLHDIVGDVAYRVMLDNDKFDESKTLPLTDVKFDRYDSDPNVTEQRITLDHTTILYDLVISIEWDADDAFIADIARGIPMAANYLYDVSDGQIGLGKVVIVEDRQLWKGADVLFTASTETWPHAGIEGFLTGNLGDNEQAILPRRWYGDPSLVRKYSTQDDWLQTYTEDNYRNFVHELGHQLLGFRDEYIDALGNNLNKGINLGFMDSQYTPQIKKDITTAYPSQLDVIYSTEMSSAERYRPQDQNTRQYVLRGGDCWTDYEKRYEKSYGGIFCPITKPSERTALAAGTNYLLGPNDQLYTAPGYDASSMTQMTIYTNSTKLFNGITTVTLTKNGSNVPFPEMQITLKKSSRTIDLGKTNKQGQLRLLGAQAGDQYLGSGTFDKQIQTLSALVPSRTDRKGDDARLASVDSNIAVTAHPVNGTFTFVPTAAYRADAGVDLGLVMNREFTQPPSLHIELDSASTIDRALGFSQSQSAYSLSLDSLPGNGLAILTGYDDAHEPFPAFLHYSTVTFSTEVYGDNGGVWLLLDSAYASLQGLTFLSSGLPSPSDGLDQDAERGGDVHALALSPAAGSLAGSNGLTIRYSDDDLVNHPETSLRIFKLNESARRWEKIGGVVDTLHNEVNVQISSAGTYAAFTTGQSSGIRLNEDAGESLSLSAAYGNGNVTIELGLADRERATLTIFNSLGQPVAVPLSQELSSGTHRLLWNPAGVPSGVYYCQVRTTSDMKTVKVSVMK